MTNPLLSTSEQAHVNAVRSRGTAAMVASALSNTAQFLKTRDYGIAFKWMTVVFIAIIAALHAIVIFQAGNLFHSWMNLVSVFANIAYALLALASPDKSLMRLFMVFAAFTTLIWV